MSLSFKKFVTFVNLEGDVSDEQINEIFGLAKNSVELDMLKAKRELLNFYGASGSLSEAVKVKAFKIEVPQDLKDDEIWDFINSQEIVTIENFERKGNTVYLFPHFDHDHAYDSHMAGAIQAEFDRFLRGWRF